MAKGSRKPRSLLMAGTQFLCFGEYLLYKSSEMYYLNSVETIEVFYNIRVDLDKLKCTSYITKIINDVTTENQNNYRILQLFLNTLYMISTSNEELEFIISIFRLRLLSIIGFKPRIDECIICRTKEELRCFSFKDSGLKCKECGKQDHSSMEIMETTKDAIKYIILADPKKVYSFSISEEAKKELELISKIYLTEKLEKEYKI